MRDYIVGVVIIIATVIITFSLVYFGKMWLVAKAIELTQNENYMQNLEEKLNIYESKYDEYCLEDSIRQVE